MERIEMGDKVRDNITGFIGVVIGKTQYITGCNQVLVQPPIKQEDGSFVEGRWIDEERLEVVEKAKALAKAVGGKAKLASTGFDKPAPVR